MTSELSFHILAQFLRLLQLVKQLLSFGVVLSFDFFIFHNLHATRRHITRLDRSESGSANLNIRLRNFLLFFLQLLFNFLL